MRQIKNEIESILLGLISKRMQAMKEGESAKDDLLGLLLESNMRETGENGQSSQGMTIEDVMEECKLFYFAGMETTSVLLTWTMILLSMHPEWQDRAREEVLALFGKNQPGYDGLSRLKTVSTPVDFHIDVISYIYIYIYTDADAAKQLTISDSLCCAGDHDSLRGSPAVPAGHRVQQENIQGDGDRGCHIPRRRDRGAPRDVHPPRRRHLGKRCARVQAREVRRGDRQGVQG